MRLRRSRGCLNRNLTTSPKAANRSKWTYYTRSGGWRGSLGFSPFRLLPAEVTGRRAVMGAPLLTVGRPMKADANDRVLKVQQNDDAPETGDMAWVMSDVTDPLGRNHTMTKARR